MRIALGSDHGGFELKERLGEVVRGLGHEVVDVGCSSLESVDYPDFAEALCQEVLSGSCQRGILVCGTGIGMSMAANRHAGIRAALCQEPFSARMSRAHNDANVLCLGGRVVGPGLAAEIVEVWLAADFEGDRHLRRIRMFSP